MTDGLKDAHREAIIAVIAANDRVERAVLFGSRATGTNTVSSDVDIALFGDRLTLTDQARLAAALDEIPMAQSVDLVLHDSVPSRTLQEHIRRQGIEWYERPTRDEGFNTSPNFGSPADWTSMNLGRACTKIGSGATPRGGKDVYLPSGPYALIRSQNVLNDGFRHGGLAYIGEQHASKLAGVEVLDRDVLVNITGDSVARVCQVDPMVLPARVNQHVAIIRPDPTKLDPGFLRYFLVCPETQARLLSWAGSGGTRNALTKGMIEAFDVPVPEDVAEQRAIARILGTLDDKIELNHRMNKTLEAMARALFKSWFVDFDPVRAKMEGRDTGLPQDIADLFPDRLVDSEMGEIPEGWEVASLGDVAALRRKGIDPASEASDTPYIGLADMPRGSIALTDWGETGSVSSRKSAFKAGDILFGKLRPYFHKVGIAPVDGLCSTDIVVLGARKPKWSAFVLACVSSSAFVAHTSQTATGTKMPRTSWQAMRRYELGRPTDTMASEFQRTVSPMLRRIVSNIHESRTLTALRDALLPKLISGEIRVPEVARALESVT